MSFWSWLFGKRANKLGADDGQAKYFKEDFDPKDSKKSVKKEKKNVSDQTKAQLNSTKVEETKAKNEAEFLTDESPEVKEADTVKESKSSVNGKFDIRKAKDGRFFFSLYASNGAVIAYSQLYSSLSAVNTGIKSIINNMERAGVEDTT